ncbi:DUF2189 domain-containing protein [Phenylobacterium sp.]|jgi:uncharacterized membrane protein|uniref:DUF2189 domain-containing protein n=1 Tax=Phenylobacterium sp. TaxID=1871053 RepID=UPI002ED894E0
MATPHHIENPFEYAVEKFAWAVRDFAKFLIPHPERHAGQVAPQVRRIGFADLRAALREGAEDMGAFRDDVLFVGLIYPIAGIVLAAIAFNANLLMMLFPLASGFAILGPVAATGLYEMSRRRELGEHVTWLDAMKVFANPAIGSIIGVGLILLSIFGVWLAVAYQIGVATLGADTPPTLRVFLENVFLSQASPTLIVGGIAVGFLFAVVAFAISVVSVPLLLDRDLGLWIAIKTSVKAVMTNPGTMAVWAMIIAFSLALGSIPALVGLIVVVPILGHASWRLYRKIVV